MIDPDAPKADEYWPLWDHVLTWEWTPATLRDGRGPERVSGDPDPDFKPRPFLGFAPTQRDSPPPANAEPVDMPDVWEGDYG